MNDRPLFYKAVNIYLSLHRPLYSIVYNCFNVKGHDHFSFNISHRWIIEVDLGWIYYNEENIRYTNIEDGGLL